MRTMDLPDVPAVTIPSDHEEAIGRYRARLSSGLRVPSRLSQSLLAHMAWPNDKKSRSGLMRSVIARRLGHEGELLTPHAISNFGGLEALTGDALDLAGDRLTAVMKKWAPVADVIQMLVDLHFSGLTLQGGPSLSKAIEICADEKSARSVGHMRRQWGLFRDVAHLLAAGAQMARETGGDGGIFSAAWYAPDSLLAIAAGYESFGLAFESHGRAESVLPPDTTWRLPPYFIPAEPWIHRRALSDRQREVLGSYRAAKN
jgi:hypothetical protein